MEDTRVEKGFGGEVLYCNHCGKELMFGCACSCRAKPKRKAYRKD